MVLSQEDHLSLDSIMPLKTSFHGLSLRRFPTRSSLTSPRWNRQSTSWQIRYAERARISLINQLFWLCILTHVQILPWLICQVSHVFQWLILTNLITSSRSPEQWLRDTLVTLELSSYVHSQPMQILLRQMVYKLRERLIKRVLEQSE